MSRPERMISSAEVKDAVFYGEIIEEYADDMRGESCLIYRTKHQRIIHVVCAPKEAYLAIITAYLPEPSQWSADLKKRK